MSPAQPPPEVRRSFGLGEGPVEPLPGGEGTSFVVGHAVVKPVFDVELGAWCQELAARVRSPWFSVPAPIRAHDGNWVVDGWTASAYVGGLEPLRSEPLRVIAVAEEIGTAFARAGLDDVGPVRRRRDRWARADRFAWDEESVPLSDAAREVADRLRARTAPTGEPVGVIHGDLTGNVHVDPDGDVVVLDLTPYVRPARLAAAIVVADHLLWHDGRLDLLDAIDGDEDGLARALLFRLTAEQLATDPRHGAELAPFRRLLEELRW